MWNLFIADVLWARRVLVLLLGFWVGLVNLASFSVLGLTRCRWSVADSFPSQLFHRQGNALNGSLVNSYLVSEIPTQSGKRFLFGLDIRGQMTQDGLTEVLGCTFRVLGRYAGNRELLVALFSCTEMLVLSLQL